jgi:hypothetical protein
VANGDAGTESCDGVLAVLTMDAAAVTVTAAPRTFVLVRGLPRVLRAWPSGLALAVRPRWVGRGLQSQRRAAGASRVSGMRSTVDAGGADPDNARRSGPGPCDFRTAIGAPGVMLTAETSSRCAALGGRYGGDRLRSLPGERCAAAAAPVGLPPGRARAKLPPRNGETPGDPSRLWLVPRLLYSFPWLPVPVPCSWPRPSGVARQRCALEKSLS